MDYSLSLDRVDKYIESAYFKLTIATEKIPKISCLSQRKPGLLMILRVVSKTWTINPSCKALVFIATMVAPNWLESTLLQNHKPTEASARV